ncbi:(d)CMP kinase [Marinimicrobium alkaliphilum]|uniref:(d)CMP kinase n=1 Tax=Marinimicrobium alkaliphilum TaxID=2202654 RepID=UPI0022B79B40|nr:(d)CMP kinase [Marinimicrobium alkaliphilum]
MTDSATVITIDGPSGSGKGTLSLLLARRLGFRLLDSGALYRLVALSALKQGIDLNDEAALAAASRSLDVHFVTGAEGVVMELAGEDVTQAIRQEQVSMAASTVAALGAVREGLLQRQRDFCQPPGLVADGRDMGTTVFPDAPVKFFLTASPEARAERRYKQLTEKGETVDMAALVEDIRARDERDSQRALSPLKPADDAVLIDSTRLSIDEVLKTMMGLVTQAGIEAATPLS